MNPDMAGEVEELKKAPRPTYPRPAMPDYHKGKPLGRQ